MSGGNRMERRRGALASRVTDGSLLRFDDGYGGICRAGINPAPTMIALPHEQLSPQFCQPLRAILGDQHGLTE